MSVPCTAIFSVAILDTSVLVATRSPLVLQNLADGAAPAYRPVWSGWIIAEWIIAETWHVLTWRWMYGCRTS